MMERCPIVSEDELEKTYVFDTPQGTRTLAELFGPRSQLLTYHFTALDGAAQKPCCGHEHQAQ
ncbi:hypothetical protein PSAC2689_70051 [Paraburkholderia sacchari]|uniref:DUF899 family protein n=1 Tax=Paraburkholderia sacchari TaxID=159450 RepID=UPI0039A6BF1B